MERQDQGRALSEWPDVEDIRFDFYDDSGLIDDNNYSALARVALGQPLLPPPPFPASVDNFSLLPPDQVLPLDFAFNLGIALSDVGSISPGASDATDLTGSMSDIYNFTGSPGNFEDFYFSPIVPAFAFPSAPAFLNDTPMQVEFGQQETDLPLLSYSSTQETTQPSESPSNTDTHQPSKPHKQKETRPVLSAREKRKVERPIKCPECGKGFPYNADCKRHIKSKHGDQAAKHGLSTERFTCDLCPSKSFSRSDHLARHQRGKKHELLPPRDNQDLPSPGTGRILKKLRARGSE